MNVAQHTTQNIALTSWIWIGQQEAPRQEATATYSSPSLLKRAGGPLQVLRQWLDGVEVRDRQLAHQLCKLIPAQCPFERDVKLFGRTLFHIPPMCKLNPLYEEVVALRFRALCYLADECGEDISAYC